jgi:hypothetical protein
MLITLLREKSLMNQTRLVTDLPYHDGARNCLSTNFNTLTIRVCSIIYYMSSTNNNIRN